MAGEKVPLKNGKPREHSRFMVFVDVPVLTMQTMALVASDEADLTNQLSVFEYLFVDQSKGAKCKIERDKRGDVVVSHLAVDWDKPRT